MLYSRNLLFIHSFFFFFKETQQLHTSLKITFGLTFHAFSFPKRIKWHGHQYCLWEFRNIQCLWAAENPAGFRVSLKKYTPLGVNQTGGGCLLEDRRPTFRWGSWDNFVWGRVNGLVTSEFLTVPWGTEWAPRKSQLKAFSHVLMMCNCFLRIKRAFYPREMLKIFCGKKGEREKTKKGWKEGAKRDHAKHWK